MNVLRSPVTLLALAAALVAAGCLDPEREGGNATRPATGSAGDEPVTSPPADPTRPDECAPPPAPEPYRHVRTNATLEQLERAPGGTFVFTSAEEWAAFWNGGNASAPAPCVPVDWRTERVAAAFMGHGGDSCLDIRIANVTKDPAAGVTRVEVVRSYPEPHEVCLEYYRVPYDLVALPKDGTRVAFVERGDIPNADPGSPVQFVMSDTYPVGATIEVKVRNTGTEPYVYNPYYQACQLEYYTEEGRKFRIPPGTHCDMVAYEKIMPGETVTLFRWNATECTVDVWGCRESRPLPAGTYHLRGAFFTDPAEERGRTYTGTSFRLQ